MKNRLLQVSFSLLLTFIVVVSLAIELTTGLPATADATVKPVPART